MERLGIFGGTFNPIHFGHLRVAVEVRELFSLDSILFIPSAQPPHKNLSNIANPKDRHYMTQLAIQSYPFFQLSSIELEREGLSYTIDTIKSLQQQYTPNIQFFYMIGIDAFLAIHTWKNFQNLFNEIPFIVMSRPVNEDNNIACMSIANNSLIDYIHTTISKDYAHNNENKCFNHPNKQPLYYCQVTSLDISASKIRRLVKMNQSIHFLLPDNVIHYMTHKQLYKGIKQT
jgi:nicotinate-nucleotide adenylyltransferase